MNRTLSRFTIVGLVLCVAAVPVRAQWGSVADSSSPTVAVFELKGAVVEKPVDNTFSFSGDTSISLKDLTARMKKARDDQSVKALVLMLDGASMGIAQIEELRQVMGQIRATDKEIFVHADSLSTGSYALLSGASHLSMVPTADLWLTGLHSEAPYLRGTLTKLGVTPDFLTCGTHKSAAEMFMREGPSKEAEEMTNWLLDGVFDTVVQLVADGRGVSLVKAKQWVDGGPYSAAQAKELGLIDAVEHRQDFVAGLKSRFGEEVKFARKYGAEKGPDIDFSSPFALFKVFGELMGSKPKPAKQSIGIVYVDGPISLGSEEVSPFGGSTGARSTSIRKALDEAAEDDNVKAVVLRVDSPGGSATASEIILDATRRVKAKKPLVVSMGNVAGSGGYYVACAADVIFADASTITGSIGVVGGKLATTDMWSKIGVTFKEYNRGENASMMSSARVFSDAERARMQAWMDEIYGVFKGHVTAIREDRLKKPLDEIAGGRVYTGAQALELGLVDKIGTLDDAIKFAASQASVGDYDVRVVPETKNFMEMIMEELGGKEGDDSTVSLGLRRFGGGSSSPWLDAALPMIKHLDPERLSAVMTALQGLDMLHNEGVILMMPTMIFRN